MVFIYNESDINQPGIELGSLRSETSKMSDISCRLPTAAALVRVRVRSCEICGGQRGTGESFLRVLRFPLPIRIPQIIIIIIIIYQYSRPNSDHITNKKRLVTK
jgi:hypothetical protein